MTTDGDISARRFTPARSARLVGVARLLAAAAATPLALAEQAADPPGDPDVPGIADIADFADIAGRGEMAGVEESYFEAGPQDVPGHEKGERERPGPPATTEPSPAEPAAEESLREWFGHSPWWTWMHATGDWGGARTWLEDHGVSIAGSYTLDWQSVWDGGISRGAGTRSMTDINITLDSLKLAGYEGGTLFADFCSTDGRDHVHPGGVQGFSNIETDANLDEVAELWYEQVFFQGLVRVKAGKVDANSEFAFVNSAAEFISGSPGVSPTILGMPSWPDPATGVNVFIYPVQRWYLGAAIYDGAMGVNGVPTGRRGPATFFGDEHSDDWFWIGETGLSWSGLGRLSAGRAGAGLWHHTGAWSRFDGGVEDGATGFYLFGEQQLWDADPQDADDRRGLWIFGQYGYADESISEIGNHAAAGLVLHGTLPGREDDAAGVYISWVDLSDDEAAGFSGDETAIELFYKFMVTPFMSIKPDLQWFINPGGDAEVNDALVGGVRIEIVL